MARPRTSALLLVGGCVVALATAAVVVRAGSAADEAVVRAVRASLEPSAPASPPPPPDLRPAPVEDLVVRAEGVDGLRLGMRTEEVVAAGFTVDRRSYDGCRRVSPGLADAGPGPGVAGWLVDDEVGAVTVDDRAGRGPSFLGPGLGDPLADLPRGEGLTRASTGVAVPWQEERVVVEVAQLSPRPGLRASFVDLSGDGLVDHVQLRTDAGAQCAGAYAEALAAERADLPVLSPQGWGEVRVGMGVGEAAALLDLQDDRQAVTAGRCRLVLAGDEPGLVYLLVGPAPGGEAGPDVVLAVAVDAGRTSEGLSVGDPAPRVQEAYPGVTASYLQERWRQGLVADWQLADGPLRLAPAREQVRVEDVDAVIEGPRPVVGMVQLGPGC